LGEPRLSIPLLGAAHEGGELGIEADGILVAFERKSIINRLELPPRCRLKITRWLSGEKGARGQEKPQGHESA